MTTKNRSSQSAAPGQAETVYERFAQTCSLAAGCAMLVVPAVVIFIAMIWLPPYAKLLQTRYDRDSMKADIADSRQQLTALSNFNERYAAGDEVLVKRLAMSHAGLWPDNESIPAGYRKPQPLIAIEPALRPAAPNRWLIKAAGRMRNTRTRRGLTLLAMGAIGSAWLLLAKSKR